MIRRLAVTAAIAASATGCLPEESAGVEVLAPADVEFPWNGAYNDADDGLAAVLPLDVLVYDGVTGEGLADVEVALSADDVRFVHADQVLSGEPDCFDCLWDAYRDEYVDLAPDAPDSPLYVRTDVDGLARVYAVVDALEAPLGDEAWPPVAVRVQLDDRERFVQLLPR